MRYSTLLLISLITEALQEQTYRASHAGQRYWISTGDNNINVTYRGYNDRIFEFQNLVNRSIQNVNLLKPSKFERIRKQRLQELKNWHKGR